ncbi:GTP cyclohydrolase 1 type 2/Nif3 [Trinorchestia longiramus]|nr:GTP cyclohydrolase 1 type 2/Nif3 [Trinorchestia longiramus]
MRVSASFLRSSLQKVTMDLKEVVRLLNDFAPLERAGSWDNVGLLVEPSSLSVSKIFLTNDLTEPVLEEAIAGEAVFILSYHPPVFKPLKKITRSHWKERIVGTCLEKGIAVYSPHTAYDALFGGVNDWLAIAFGESSVLPVEPSVKAPSYSHQIKIVSASSNSLDELQRSLDNLISTCEDQSIKILSDSHHLPVSVLCSKKNLPSCVNVISKTPVEFVVSRYECVPEFEAGIGRKVTLTSTQTIGSVVEKLKTMTGLSHVRLALAASHNLDTVVKTGAVCAGSGISVLREVQADLLVSGEMSHHDVLEYTQTNRSVILLEHSNSERGFLSAVLQPKLQQLFEDKLSVVVSQADHDPLQIV